MKRVILILCVATAPVSGQLIVHDPVNTAVATTIKSAQAASHLETLQQWAGQMERLNRQIRQLEDQLIEQRRIREVLGDPTLAGAQLVLDGLAPEELARSYGETLQAVRRLADATGALRRTAEGIYGELEDVTALQQGFTRQQSAYRRYAAVEAQAEQAAKVHEATGEREAALQADLAASLVALRHAATQAEVDKLSVKIGALHGQIARLAAVRRDEGDKLLALQIQNDNQAAKERQDLLEKQIAEERQTLEIVNDWQRRIQVQPGSYHRP